MNVAWGVEAVPRIVPAKRTPVATVVVQAAVPVALLVLLWRGARRVA